MPARSTAMALTLGIAASVLAAVASCRSTDARDAAPCDAAPPSPVAIARCAADAQATERRADHATGIAHATYLVRAASEWRKAAMASNRREPRARRWLAHAMVLDERVQDDPDVPLELRRRAKDDEALARAELVRRR